jgi:hypothetical protein
MRVDIGDVRLFFDMEGAKLRPDGATMREVPAPGVARLAVFENAGHGACRDQPDRSSRF